MTQLLTMLTIVTNRLLYNNGRYLWTDVFIMVYLLHTMAINISVKACMQTIRLRSRNSDMVQIFSLDEPQKTTTDEFGKLQDTLLHLSMIFQSFDAKYLAMHTVQKHICALSKLLYGFASIRTIIDSLKILNYLPVEALEVFLIVLPFSVFSRTQRHESVLGAVVLLLCSCARYTVTNICLFYFLSFSYSSKSSAPIITRRVSLNNKPISATVHLNDLFYELARLFCSVSSNICFQNILSGILSQNRTLWIQFRSHVFADLVWV